VSIDPLIRGGKQHGSGGGGTVGMHTCIHAWLHIVAHNASPIDLPGQVMRQQTQVNVVE
jgi:hypothetical protein